MEDPNIRKVRNCYFSLDKRGHIRVALLAVGEPERAKMVVKPPIFASVMKCVSYVYVTPESYDNHCS